MEIEHEPKTRLKTQLHYVGDDDDILVYLVVGQKHN